MNLTLNQADVLKALRDIGRTNFFRYAASSPYLFQEDCKKVAKGDYWCVFGMGGLSYQIAGRIDGLSTGTALSVLKQLERRGFVIRETVRCGQGRPLYWWPVSFADQLCAELPAAMAPAV